MTTTALTRLLAAIDALEDGDKEGLGPGYENGHGVEAGTELQAAREQARSAIAQAAEPFGYFRAEPFGWTNCAETDEGAIALYEHPAAKASTAAMGWRPIETAPKDETPVDLWSPEWGGERHTNMRRVSLSKGNVFYDPVEAGTCCVRSATYWMPLPPAPQGDGHEQS
jgi:hypothetical protein